MKRIKRFLILFIAGVMTLSVVACSSGSAKEGAPTLKDEKEIFIGAYCAPHPLDEQYQFVAESGINHLMVGGGDYFRNYPYTTEEYYRIPFDLAEKYGIKVIMHIEDNSYKVLGDCLEEVKTRESLDGFLVCDEPPKSRFKYYMDDYQSFKNDFNNMPYYINLLPIYSDNAQLGGCDYNEYLTLYQNMILKNYVAGQRIVLCDCYPLMNNDIYQKWLYNIELLQNMSRKVDGKVYLFLQAQGFLGRWRQPWHTSEILYQIYVSLACGVEGFAYYPYQMPSISEPYELCAIDIDGKKTYMFDLIKEANAELKKIDGILLDFDWKGVIMQKGKNNIDENDNFIYCHNKMTKYGVLKSVEASKDTVVGCFENSNGYQGFLAVNFEDPISEFNDEVTLKFDGATKAVVYTKGEPKTVSLNDGVFTQKLGMGEGVFVVPYKD